MRSLPEHSDQQWSSQILEDLSFIKKHKRYPLRRMTLMPLLSSGFVLIFLARLIWMMAFTASFFKKDNSSFLLLLLLLVAVPTVVAFKRYIDLVRFFEIPTEYFLAENIVLLQQFLKEQHLLVSRHAEAPEIFQIISRNIDALGEEREVLIFIADDKRILINSHFTGSRKRFKFFSAPTHHREMMKQLIEWMSKLKSSEASIVKI